uniref:Uncharacterized protein n=1 Tax=Arundo donax TaxID=35708 RepID=A0A0A9E7K2_ARUDO
MRRAPPAWPGSGRDGEEAETRRRGRGADRRAMGGGAA